MKKLIFASAFMLGTLLTVNAQTDDKVAPDAPSAEKTSKKLIAQNSDEAAAQEYRVVNVAELPQPVSDAIAKKFEGATISNAQVNAQNIYKVEVAKADKTRKTVYVNAKGELIKKE